MNFTEKFDRLLTGVLSAFLLPLLTGFIVFLFTSGTTGLHDYINRIIASDIVTHAISLCVIPNVVIFLVFNRLDMLKALRGVLGVTFFWAIVVFGIKLFI